MWQRKDFSQAQHRLVVKQLAQPVDKVLPFAAFQRIMQGEQLDGKTLLDVGCGVGHYGVLCSRLAPGLQYTGTDVSESMIEIARGLCPTGTFAAKSFYANEFAGFDYVLIGQVMECTDDPTAALKHLLSYVDGRIILHRLHYTDEQSHIILAEPTYCGKTMDNFAWNLFEITELVKSYGRRTGRMDLWDSNCTMMIYES